MSAFTSNGSYVVLYTRGEPGIDWDINNPLQSDITKVFYSVYDPNAASSLSKPLHTYICSVMLHTNFY